MSQKELPPSDGHLASIAQQEQLRPDELTPSHIFSKGIGFLLTEFGSCLQGVLLDMNFLNSGDPPNPQSAEKIRAGIKRTCEKLGIPDDEGSLRQFGLNFYALVRQRQEEVAERTRPVLTEA